MISNFFRFLWLACSGFRTYARFLDLPLRATLGYWAGWSAILGVVLLGNVIFYLKTSLPLMERAAQSLPEFSLIQGEAHSPLPQPHYANTNRFPIILDLEGAVHDPEKRFPAGLLIRKKELFFWKEGWKPALMKWNRGFPDGRVDADYVHRLGRDTLKVAPFFLPVFWLGIMLAGLLQAFLFTVFAGFLERTMAPGFTFSQLFNLAVFAITPASLIVAAWNTAGFHELGNGLVYFACYGFFLVMAAGACRSRLRADAGRPGEKQDGPED